MKPQTSPQTTSLPDSEKCFARLQQLLQLSFLGSPSPYTKTNPVNFSRTFKRFSFLDFSPNKSIACLIGPELQHLQTYCSSTPPGRAFTLSLFHWYFVRHFGLKTPLEKLTRALGTEAKSGNLGTNYSYFHFRSNCSCSDFSQ